jgi:hypothetical protein
VVPRSNGGRCPIMSDKSTQHQSKKRARASGAVLRLHSSLPVYIQSVAFRLSPRFLPCIAKIPYKSLANPVSQWESDHLLQGHPVFLLSSGYRPRPPTTSAVILAVKSISTSSSSLGVRECIAFFDRGASPAPGGLGAGPWRSLGISDRNSWTRFGTRAFSHKVASSSKCDTYPFFLRCATYVSVCHLHWCSFRRATKHQLSFESKPVLILSVGQSCQIC